MGRWYRVQAPGDEGGAARVKAGAGVEIEFEVGAEAANHPIPHGAGDGELLTRVGEVAGDLVPATSGLDHDLLVD
jgi:hypothetical protein